MVQLALIAVTPLEFMAYPAQFVVVICPSANLVLAETRTRNEMTERRRSFLISCGIKDYAQEGKAALDLKGLQLFASDFELGTVSPNLDTGNVSWRFAFHNLLG